MNSRERVVAAINHQQPDRVPIDLNGSAASGIHVYAYVNLRKHLGLSLDQVQVFDMFGMMAWVEQDVLERFGTDFLLVPSLTPRFGIPINAWKPWRLPDGTPVQVPLGFQSVEDNDGSLLLMVDGEAVGRMPKSMPYFLDMVESDMGGLEALADPPNPDTVEDALLTDEDLRFRQETAKNVHEATDKALIVELLEPLRWNTSITNWLYALAADPQKTFELHEKRGLNMLEKVKQLAHAVGPYVTIFAIYQDFGTQRGELISPDLFKWSIVPPYRRIFDWIHQNTNWKVWFHSCGSIYRLIPHMIEMGIDILNPVQCNTPNMEPERLKKEFGDRLVFWGGGTDTQTVLPFGTPDEVQQQVRERISTLGADGGYVFAPSQDIQADVPPENLVAMYDAAQEYGRYPVSNTE
jgi:uroporphyrinogen decarboxylase